MRKKALSALPHTSQLRCSPFPPMYQTQLLYHCLPARLTICSENLRKFLFWGKIRKQIKKSVSQRQTVKSQ
jgi:hypothetical protein